MCNESWISLAWAILFGIHFTAYQSERVCVCHCVLRPGGHSIVKKYGGGWLDSFQTCQVSMLRMSEKFVDPPKNVSSVARKIFWGAFWGVWGHAPPEKILKIMYPRLAKIAFHGISAVKIKCHLTIY